MGTELRMSTLLIHIGAEVGGQRPEEEHYAGNLREPDAIDICS